MRQLNTSFLAAIAQTITDPIYLFKVAFQSSTIYATSREAVSYSGDSYNYKGADLISIRDDRVQFSLPNETRAVSPLAFGEQIQGNEVEVYLAYQSSDTPTYEVLARFVGLLEAPRMAQDYNSVIFTASSIYASSMRWPYERIREPTFNHLPPPGRTLRIGNVRITLERDQN